MTEVYYLSEHIYRIRHWNGVRQRDSLAGKYGLINLTPDGEPTLLRADTEDTVTLERGYTLSFRLASDAEGGFSIRLPLFPDDKLFGLGGGLHGTFEKRGSVIPVKQDVYAGCYGTIPYLMSSRGWAVLINCTYAHTFDVGAEDPDTLHIFGDRGGLDLLVFCGSDMKEALYLSGKVTGRPVMLPRQAFGVTMVHSIYSDARSILDDALRCRERDLPCDYFGLEPNWMEKNYDTSTTKKWDYKKFPAHAHYQPEDVKCNELSWIWNLNQMGIGLSLWLCMEYDLFWKEEEDVFQDQLASSENLEYRDAHLSRGRRMDRVTKPGEAWFEHLKKFVNNGAEAFKLDASYQCVPHPDRIWGGQYSDDEIRNIYPVVYAKQMKEGYQAHTEGRRAMINTCGIYLGTQKYAATWAGDTGTGLKVLMSLLDLSMCGHSNTSFDFNYKIPAIHFGFLAPWTQYVTWCSWNQPWYAPDGTEESYRMYGRLRSQLFPYLYTLAHIANTTSLPMARPLRLQYQDTDRYDEIQNEYMLGESLLVGVFDNNITLPEEDEWFCFYDGVKHTGLKTFHFTPPSPLYGGALYVRAGSILVMNDPMRTLRNYRPEILYVHVYPGRDTAFTLYEDDGTTYEYEEGRYAETKMTLTGNVLRIYPREGHYRDMSSPAAFKVILHRDDGSTEQYDADAYRNKDGISEIVFA